MKISKLFHWLYALVMFLPVFFWIPTAFYYGFNEHATNPSTTDVHINYKYQSNEVNNVDDLFEGNIYNFNFENSTLDSYISIGEGGYLMFEILQVNDYDFNNYNISLDDAILSATANSNISFVINISDSLTASFAIYFQDVYEGNDYFLNLYIGSLDNDAFTLTGICRLIDIQDLVYIEDNTFSYTDYNEIVSVDVIQNGGISNAMNQSWQDVWSLPMFSWTHDTFFSAPFNYIAGLFGIQSGNTLSYCLSYWFSISIIWLVFDLMIYVPLLVHRWLDKAGIQ